MGSKHLAHMTFSFVQSKGRGFLLNKEIEPYTQLVQECIAHLVGTIGVHSSI